MAPAREPKGILMKLPLSSFSRKQDRTQRRSRVVRPRLEGLEDRLVLSLVAASASDAKINVTSPLDQTVPSVAMDANGDYVVAWNNQITAGSELSLRRRCPRLQLGRASPDGRDRRRPDDWRHTSLGGHGRQWRLRRRLSGLEYQHLRYGISAQRFNLAGAPQGSTMIDQRRK